MAMGESHAGFGDRTVRNEFSQLMLTSPGTGAWIWNLPTNAVTWSQEVYSIFDAPDFDHTVESFRNMIVPDDMEAGLAVVSRALTSRETFRTHFRVKTPKGRYRRVMNTGRAIYDKSGKPKMVIGLVTDVEHVTWPGDLLPDNVSGSAGYIDRSIADIEELHEHFLNRREQSPSSETDHKILTLLLDRIMESGEARKLATALLEKFDGIGEMLGAGRPRLKEVKGVKEKHIKLLEVVRYAMESVLRPRSEPLKFGHPDTLINYLRATHAYQHKEQLRIVFLNRADHLIASEIMQEGTVDHTPVYAREVLKRALELSASAIILVHNHPSGNPTPSLADLDLTSRISKLATGLGIDVRDHIIMGRYGHTSLRAAGLF